MVWGGCLGGSVFLICSSDHWVLDGDDYKYLPLEITIPNNSSKLQCCVQSKTQPVRRNKVCGRRVKN
jgi:hypothetical protein